MKRNFKFMLYGLFVSFLLVFGACSVQQGSNLSNGKDIDSKLNNSILKYVKIDSEAELKKYLRENYNGDLTGAPNIGLYRNLGISAKALGVAEESSSDGISSRDYTSTNLQELGVDEADIIKTNGDYIFVIANNNLVVYDATNPKDLKEVLKMNLSGNYEELFLIDNKVILLGNSQNVRYEVNEYSFVPEEVYDYLTSALIYEFENEELNLVENYSLSGNYYDARVIGNNLYFVSKEYRYYPLYDIMPFARVGDKKVAGSYYILPRPDSNYVTYTIAGVSLDNLEDLSVESILAGYDSTLYVSENNLFLATELVVDLSYFEQRVLRFETAVLPLFDDSTKARIESIDKTDEDNYFVEVSKVLDEYYNTLSELELKDFKKGVEVAIQRYDSDFESKRSKTNIMKFGLADGKVSLSGQGSVAGRLLNQFSLSEFDGFLRVATTVNYWSGFDGQKQYNNVYVLNDELKVVGSLENLAQNESIYSSRFEGDKLYLVTFRQVDPFFVIDLSNPEKPEVLGYLKIPGFSSYLHKISDNIVIGIGKDTKESEFGGVITDGLKITLFDVSDFSNPKELDTFKVEGRWSDSEVLREHKAFFYDSNRSLLAVPVLQSRNLGKEDYYGNVEYWNGVLVFDLSQNTLDLKARLRVDDWTKENYWNSGIKRIFRIDDVLFSLSNVKLINFDLTTYDKIEEYKLPEYTYDNPILYSVESPMVKSAIAID